MTREKVKKTIGKILLIGLCAAGTLLAAPTVQAEDVSYIEESPQSRNALIDNDGNAYFFLDTDIIRYQGSYESGKMVPDQTKYLLLDKEGVLTMQQSDSMQKTQIDTSVFGLYYTSDAGVYYATSEKGMCYYQFSDGVSYELGVPLVSAIGCFGNTALACIDSESNIYVYISGQSQAEYLCTAEEGADILAVSDDGYKVMWEKQTEEGYEIYLIKNGKSSSIGVLKTEKDNPVYATFFNGGKGYMVYSEGATNILLFGGSGNPLNVNLGGYTSDTTGFDCEGRGIDSEDDNIKKFFIPVISEDDESVETLYSIVLDGKKTSKLAAGPLSLNDNYYLTNGYIYYVDENKNFIRQRIDGTSTADPENYVESVTSVNIPTDNEYAYVRKSGTLYYTPLDTVYGTLNKISDNISEDDKIYTTDDTKTIYYITDLKDVEGTDKKIGTLYRYTVGGTPEKIADNIYEVYGDPSSSTYGDGYFGHDINAKMPYIAYYQTNADNTITQNVGTIYNDRFAIVIENFDWDPEAVEEESE